jgi:hypothetical protein
MRGGPERTLPSPAAGPAATVIPHETCWVAGAAQLPEKESAMARIGVQSEELRQQATTASVMW